MPAGAGAGADGARVRRGAGGLAQRRGGSPEDWEALHAAYEAACDEARATFFSAYGEEEMARLYLEDRFTFHRRFESGRRFFHGLPMLPEHLH
ncbi:hypothetical protein A176_006671 [Myxococcus hansupus]|uniref:Uncharacterized protein n=1 Tax=Pseudomyxococcus hansupus TaxID=1297742 RepID=A0A0H4X3J5_9BACT|nr:hypothetical protein A176_006671 [Myxococcus hansupus]